jgi:hypothetical protein
LNESQINLFFFFFFFSLHYLTEARSSVAVKSTSREVEGLIPAEMNEFFSIYLISSRTRPWDSLASNRNEKQKNVSGSKARSVHRAGNLTICEPIV